MDNIKYINRQTGKLITENPPGEGYLKFLYHTAFGKLALNVLVKRKLLSVVYGGTKDKPKSVKDIPQFVEDMNIDMSEAVKSMDEFKTFNEFFYRKLKPEARPIGEGLVSPADAKLIAFESVEEVGKFFVKGQEFQLKDYLQSESMAAKYKNASMFIFRLAPNDYHRYHFPYSGMVGSSKKIKGRYYSVSPYALQTNFTKVFCENKREFLELKTEDKGDILLSPVGATMVGSIYETFTPNSQVEKGDEMGYFGFGGSTVVMLVDRSKIMIDQDIIESTKNGIEMAVKMGERIGI